LRISTQFNYKAQPTGDTAVTFLLYKGTKIFVIEIMVKFTKSSIIYMLLVFTPIAFILDLSYSNATLLFVVSIISLIPLAKLR